MADEHKPTIGTIAWTDLTVPNATEVRDFYKQVVGWQSSDVPVEDHVDYNMLVPGSDTSAAGICHALGGNAGLPAQWLIYIVVADLDQSIAACQKLGGKVISGPRSIGSDRMVVVQDPAGAVVALYQKG